MESANQAEHPRNRLKTQREIKRLVKVWAKRLGLDGYQIRVSWGPALPPSDPRLEDKESTPYASSHSLSEYRSGHLYFDIGKIPPQEDLEQLVVHELVHFMLGPLQDSVQDFVEACPKELQPVVSASVERAVERTCTDVAKTFVLLVAGKPFGKLHFDEKESLHGHPESDVEAGTKPRR